MGDTTTTAKTVNTPQSEATQLLSVEVIEGDMHLEMPEGMESSHVKVSLPRYRRTFTLSKELDTGKVAAEFEQGVLKLRIPKAAHAQPRKIEIRVE